MTYLGPLRLHFAGQFRTTPSTVNNDPVHYDVASFKSSYRERATSAAWNGWWNPGGGNDWRFLGCKVTAAFLADGSPAASDDIIRTALVADSDEKVAAKLVDLDPEQQLVSEIWGLEIRVCDKNGAVLVRGDFEPAGFMDIWDRYPKGTGDGIAGAYYQSVLTNLTWTNTASSPFLEALRSASAASGRLSIKFNVDSYDTDFKSPTFLCGRVAGTIGPAMPDEPMHLVLGRQFMPTGAPGGQFFAPAGGINFATAVVDASRGKVYVDVGNALPISGPSKGFVNLGSLELACEVQPASGSGAMVSRLDLGPIVYADPTQPTLYEQTAGIFELPAGRVLTAAEMRQIAANPLVLLLPDPATSRPVAAVAEPVSGVYVRADRHVFRLNPGESATTQLYATRYGAPYSGATIIAIHDDNELQPSSFLGKAPPVGTPAGAIQFPRAVVTGASGVATLEITTSDPGNPRGYIDGQVYGVRPVLEETICSPTTYPFNQWDFVSLLVWTDFKADDPPTWLGSLEPIFKQYANLYPAMDRFVNLADYESVCATRELLLLGMDADVRNPNAMPVTRELSGSKRRAIRRWLTELVDGKPRLGTPRPPAPVEPAAAVDAAPEPAPPTPDAPRGGKAVAVSRRLKVLRQHSRDGGITR